MEMNPTEMSNQQFLERSRQCFKGLNRDQLKQAATWLGVEYAPQTNNDTLARKCREMVGVVDSTLSESQIDSLSHADASTRGTIRIDVTPPNLTAAGRWEGRYQRVDLHRPEHYRKFRAYPFCWEGSQRYFHFDTPVDMPWPYFEILKT